jgi:hypothetical protein
MMPRFVAIEHWYAEAGSFGEAHQLHDDGGFVAGGFVDIFEVREDGGYYDETGERMEL